MITNKIDAIKAARTLSAKTTILQNTETGRHEIYVGGSLKEWKDLVEEIMAFGGRERLTQVKAILDRTRNDINFLP